MKKYIIAATFIAVAASAFIATLAFAGDPGSSSLDALPINGKFQFIQPQSSLWFYFDYSGDKKKIEAWVDDNLNVDPANTEIAKNVELVLYTPTQAQDWFRDNGIQPIGRGSRPPNGIDISSHDLYWSGNFNFGGRFFAVVKNSNTIPIQFSLWVQGDSVKLYPIPTPTSVYPKWDDPLAAPIPSVNITGTFIFQESSGGNIYTMTGDGTTLKKITYGFDPSWSPDGKMIAFARWDEPTGLYIANADGSNPVRVWNGPQFQSPQWNPDGKRIAFKEGNLDLGVVELNKQIDADTTKNVLTEPPCTKHCFAPAWSPDGRYIVYADAGVGVMSTDTMTNSIWTLFNDPPKVETPSYSPDGSKVVFQYAQHDHWEILVMNLADGNLTQLTQSDPLSFRLTDSVAPEWSPDGKQILFLSNRRGKWEFFVVNADGTNLRQVFKNITDQLTMQYYFSNERVIDWRR